MCSSTRGRASAPKVCAHLAEVSAPGGAQNASPRASDESAPQPSFWPGHASPMNPRAESPNTVGSSAAGADAHPRVLAEELMQKARHHREGGHLGCVIRDTLEKSMGDGEGGEGEDKNEF